MTAVTETSSPALSRQRILDLADYAVQGSWPREDCTACARRADGWCEECAATRADNDVLQSAQRAIQEAYSGTEALVILLNTIAALAGADMDRRTQLAVLRAVTGSAA